MKKSCLIRGATIAVALAAEAGMANADPHMDRVLKSLRAGRPHVANQLLVQYRQGTNEAGVQQALAAEETLHAETLISAADQPDAKGDLKLVQVPPGKSLAEAIETLSRDGNVEYVEPDWILQHQGISNDPYYTDGRLWGMYGAQSVPSNGNGSHAGETWTASNPDCSNVYIGVIDEGIMKTHEDLAANVWVNPYDPVDGVDNDGNGYVDDTNGWDFAGNDNTVYDGASDDHGTHVAGTIAAVGGNGKGVAGACWNAKLISAKFLGSSGGSTSNAVKAIDYITNLKTRHGLNIVATNNSWGGGGYSKALYDAIERANKANILFVAAAGNSSRNVDTSNEYPAKYPNSNIISVAAITSNGGLASFSNYGAKNVDLGAPGSGIYSTVPSGSGGSGYASYSGTSMATPHVTGAVALYAATHSGASAEQIKAAILNNTAPTSSLAGRTVTGGRLDIGKAIQAR